MNRLLLLSLAVFPGLATAQPYVHEVALTGNDTPESILEKAANVVPSPRQLDFLEMGFTSFIHFGINTYTGAEWGTGKENAALFNPGDTFDPDQWVRAAKSAGMRMVVFTVKHHDGFCLWQSRYNSKFSVRSIPWKNGKADVLKPLAAACRKHGLKLGVYLSPADLYQMESKDGLYGNGSKYQPTTIPTDPASFSSAPTKVRADKPAAAPVFRVEADDYNRYFMNQLYELLTEYGPIHEVWFDGAHPKTKGGQKYIKEEWFKMIRALAPQAVIFGGPDVRWCGNEAGRTRANEWNVLPAKNNVEAGADRTKEDLGSDQVLTTPPRPENLYYIVPEIDTSIRSGWFWRNEHEQGVRTADDVFDIYERTTGGNGVFLLNIPPGNRGLFAPRDVATLEETGRRIRATYGTRAIMAGASCDQPTLIDGKTETTWQAPSTTTEITVTFPNTRTINRVAVMEDIAKTGQRVKGHTLEVRIGGQWREVAKAGVIGYRRILRFPEVNAEALRIKITAARLAPALAEIAAYHYAAPPPALAAARGADDLVSITVPAAKFAWKSHGQGDDSVKNNYVIRYTTDGTVPTVKSAVYEKAIVMPDGGTVKAAAFSGGKPGPLLEARIPISRKGWTIVSASSSQKGYEATMAIDGDPKTFWHTDWGKKTPHPHTLVIDTSAEKPIGGFTYLPRQDKAVPDGMIETGEVSLSRDGKSWTAAEPFHFGNLVNDPAQRTFLFKKPATARYFRLVSKSGAAGKPYAGAAEIGLLGK